MEFQNKNTIRFHFDNSGSAEKAIFGTDYFDDGTKFLVHQGLSKEEAHAKVLGNIHDAISLGRYCSTHKIVSII